jgi:hypothetical protein
MRLRVRRSWKTSAQQRRVSRSRSPRESQASTGISSVRIRRPGACFAIGLLALLVGLPALGLGLWAACVWLDWRVLAYLRTAPADAICLRQYVNRRVTTNGIAQVLAIVLGLYLATSGHPWLAFGIWAAAAGGSRVAGC